MKKYILFLLVLALVLSCSSDTTGETGTVSFYTPTTKAVAASIDYPDPTALTWTIISTKTDNGENIGQGTETGMLLTDTFGPYSTGTWTFTLKGYNDGNQHIYQGTTDATINVGNNAVAITVSPLSGSGTLSLENCNVDTEMLGYSFNNVCLMIDGSDITAWNYLSLEKNGTTYSIPTYTQLLSSGVHELKFRYERENANDSYSEVIKFRVEANLTTHFTYGTFKGTTGFTVTVNEQDAIVTD